MKNIDTIGYPKHIAEWLMNDEYDYVEGTISATALLKPARIHALTKRHWDEIQIDIQHLESSKIGNAVHDSLEKAPMSNVLLKEKRFYAEVDGIKLSGKPDLILKSDKISFNGRDVALPFDRIGNLKDYKTTKTWKFIFGSSDEDYIKQLSVYRYIMFRNGIYLDDKGEIDFFFTNWIKQKAINEQKLSYKIRLHRKTFSLMTTDDTENWIQERLSIFKSVESLNDNDLPECIQKELWFDEDKYAVMKGSNIKAARVLDTEKDAENYIDYLLDAKPKLKKKDMKIIKRPGQAKRCNPYCPVRRWCNQYRKMLKNGLVFGIDSEKDINTELEMLEISGG